MDEGEVKVVLVGESNVGKTCIVRRLTSGVFDEVATPTLGAGYATKDVHVNETAVELQIWDTAGTEKYKGMAPMFYREAKAALLCFSITSRESFEKVDYWVESLRANLGDSVALFLVGNKLDLANEREVQVDEAEEYRQRINAVMYMEVSAKTGQAIEQLFTFVASEAIRSRAQGEIEIVPIRDKGYDNDTRRCCH